MSTPAATFSVIIPLFDKARFVVDTIESVFAQRHPALEIIVVDDASTDGGADLVERTFGDQVTVMRQPNAGPGPARNRGVEAARGDWIAFLDADDRWRPDHLATLNGLATRFPTARTLSTRFATGQAGQEARLLDHAQPTAALLDYFAMPLDRPTMWTSCVAVERVTFLASGGFGAFVPGEDLDLWVRLALAGPVAASTATTALYVRETEGLMEQSHDAPAGYHLQPVFDTIARALGDPVHRARHAALRAFRGSLLRRNLRQALFHNDPASARRYLADLRRFDGGGAGVIGLLAFLPRPILGAALRLRQRVRGRP